jgi:hypothetical protein
MSSAIRKYLPLILIILGLAVGLAYYFKFEVKNERACTLEAMICPDGSAVGRTGPNCEFSPCP